MLFTSIPIGQSNYSVENRSIGLIKCDVYHFSLDATGMCRYIVPTFTDTYTVGQALKSVINPEAHFASLKMLFSAVCF